MCLGGMFEDQVPESRGRRATHATNPWEATTRYRGCSTLQLTRPKVAQDEYSRRDGLEHSRSLYRTKFAFSIILMVGFANSIIRCWVVCSRYGLLSHCGERKVENVLRGCNRSSTLRKIYQYPRRILLEVVSPEF